jgi:ribosomal protein S18 acetylase RimI-like enzyme
MASDLRLDERILSRSELTNASLVATRAFFNDPFFRFLSPSERLRTRGLTLFIHANLAHFGEGGRIVTVRQPNDTIVGVAAWLPTGRYPQSVGTQLTQIPGTFRALYRRPRALIDGNKYLIALTKAHPKEAHWYLFLLLADPSIQRSGVGTMLMHHGLALADADGVGGYLETQNEDNLAYYRRFGYELRETLKPVKEGPPLYTMWRRPR